MSRLVRFTLLSVLLLSIYLTYVWQKIPNQSLFKWLSYSSIYYDESGKLLRFSLASDDRYRLWVPYKQIPKELVNATILYEDRYYYSHPGVNFIALWRAFLSTYFTGERRVGASTITMQVAKVAFSLPSQTIFGKIQQIFYAFWLEQHYTKEEILEYYFNIVSYGGNIEGVEAASQIYFHKNVSMLSLPEILSLVVIPQNPTKRNLKSKAGYKRMLRAREHLYTKYKEIYLTHSNEKNQVDLWMQLPLHVHSDKELPFIAPHFITHYEKTHPFHQGIINTTLKLKSQKILEQQIDSWVNQNKTKGITNAAALLINTKTMGVEAWVGSADFYNETILGQVDAITAKRSPGSSLKPFVYALAMDQGLIHPISLLKDAPDRFGAYTPENYDKIFLGPISATEALIASRNVPAVRLSSQLKEPSLYEFLQKSQVTDMKEAQHYGISIALGGMEVSMLELGRMYAILGNEGYFRDIKLSKDEKEEENIPKLLSSESAWLTLDMLKQNPPPHEKNFLGTHKKRATYAWKTGTSYAFRDAWSSGLSKDHVLVVWVGNFDGKGNPNFIGREAAGPLFFNIMHALNEKEALDGNLNPQESFLNISKVDICEATGTLPNKLCPHVKKSWFIPGVSPIQNSNIFREVPINIKTGKRACFYEKGKTKLQVFEFWPSDLLEIFKMAGIKKKQPPEFEEACANLSSLAQKPQIQSPANNLIYTLEEEKIADSIIPFQAILDADSHKAFWFVDKDYVGTTKASQTLFWKAKLGNFTVRVVDENGLSAKRKISVELAH